MTCERSLRLRVLPSQRCILEEKAAKLQADHIGLSGEDDGDDGSNSYSSSSSGEIDWSPILDFVAETIVKHEDAAASFR